jgi:uncharacterized membrane protein
MLTWKPAFRMSPPPLSPPVAAGERADAAVGVASDADAEVGVASGATDAEVGVASGADAEVGVVSEEEEEGWWRLL